MCVKYFYTLFDTFLCCFLVLILILNAYFYCTIVIVPLHPTRKFHSLTCSCAKCAGRYPDFCAKCAVQRAMKHATHMYVHG